MTAAAVALAALMGLLIGSFLNVVIWRLPRGESLVRPGSACPACGTPVRPYDNVPVLSWLLLRGRCRDCGEGISARYPLVEALTAVLLALVVLKEGADRIIPNTIMLVALVAGVAILVLTRSGDLAEHGIAAAGAGGFLLLAALARPGGMGMGDVKLAGVMGLYLGRAVIPALFVALIAGSVLGAIIIARKGAKEGRKTAVPFGPFLALGGVAGLFAGDAIVDWYLDTFV